MRQQPVLSPRRAAEHEACQTEPASRAAAALDLLSSLAPLVTLRGVSLHALSPSSSPSLRRPAASAGGRSLIRLAGRPVQPVSVLCEERRQPVPTVRWSSPRREGSGRDRALLVVLVRQQRACSRCESSPNLGDPFRCKRPLPKDDLVTFDSIRRRQHRRLFFRTFSFDRMGRLTTSDAQGDTPKKKAATLLNPGTSPRATQANSHGANASPARDPRLNQAP